MTRSLVVWVALLFVATTVALQGKPKAATATAGAWPPTLTLTDMRSASSALPQAKVSRLLTADETRRMLARLTPLRSSASRVQGSPNGGEQHPVAPRPSDVVRVEGPSFVLPPPAAAPVASPQAAAPFRVDSVRPLGLAFLRAQIVLHFSRTVVPVGASGPLNAATLSSPAGIVEGQWSWLDPATLSFEPASPLSPATLYRIDVARGLRAADGTTLDAPFQSTFTTRGPAVSEVWPQGEVPPGAPILIVFDHPVDAPSIVPRIHLWHGKRRIDCIAVDERERGAFEGLQRKIDRLPGETWVCVKPLETLPRGTGFRVGVDDFDGSGFYSTLAPLTVSNGWGERDEPHHVHLHISLSHPLADSHVGAARVTPTLRQMKLEVHGQQVDITGLGDAKRYAVRLEGITDVYGRTRVDMACPTIEISPEAAHMRVPMHRRLSFDPTRPPMYPIEWRGALAWRVEVWKVSPSLWRRYAQAEGSLRAFGPPTWSRHFDGASDGSDHEGGVDLRPFLDQGHGSVIVRLRARMTDGVERETTTWVDVSDLAVHVVQDFSSTLVWVTSRSRGTALEGVNVSAGGASGVTNADGLARLPAVLTQTKDRRHRLIVTARRGTDSTVWGEDSQFDGWAGQSEREQLVAAMTEARGIYRPGDEVRVKGWLRRVVHTPEGDVEMPGPSDRTLTYRLLSGADVRARGRVDLDAQGGFDLQLRVPTDMRLGQASLVLTAPRCDVTSLWFRVEEYRRPDMSVSVAVPQGAVAGEGGVAEATARNYSGTAVSGAEVHWSVSAYPSYFFPPQPAALDGQPYTFFTDDFGATRPTALPVHVLDGNTGREGCHRLKIDASPCGRPLAVKAEATVIGAGGQPFTAEQSFLLHSSSVYVGVRRSSASPSGTARLDVVVTDLQGHLVPNCRVEMVTHRTSWTSTEPADWTSQAYGVAEVKRELHVDDERRQSLRSSTAPLHVDVACATQGRWQADLTVYDAAGRPNRASLEWFEPVAVPAEARLRDSLTLTADKRVYGPHETAHLEVRSTRPEADGLLLLGRDGLVRAERFHLQDGVAHIDVPLSDALTPNVHLTALMGGVASSASTMLTLEPVTRRLAVEATPAASRVRPGERTRVDVRVRDAFGRPVADAQTAIIVVDQATQDLVGHDFRNPLDAFMELRPRGTFIGLPARLYDGSMGTLREDGNQDWQRSRVRMDVNFHDTDAVVALRTLAAALNLSLVTDNTVHGRVTLSLRRVRVSTALRLLLKIKGWEARAFGRILVVGSTETLAKIPMDIAGGRLHTSGPGPAEAPVTSVPEPSVGDVRTRSDMRAVAAFEPAVRTNADGRVSVDVRMPDALTRYKVVALASAGVRQFGIGGSSVTVRAPLELRLGAPRFAYIGDTFAASMSLLNDTAETRRVRVALRATAEGRVLDGDAREVTLAPMQRTEVPFRIAVERTGELRIQAIAEAEGDADATLCTVAIRPARASQVAAVTGTLDDGRAVAIPLQLPVSARSDESAVDVSTATSLIDSLSDVVDELYDYRYGCSEQLASRVLVLSALGSSGPASASRHARLQKDVRLLVQRQKPNGAFGLWSPTSPDWPYLDVHVTYALAVASQRGVKVPSDVLDQARLHLQRLRSELSTDMRSRRERIDTLAQAACVSGLLEEGFVTPARELARAVKPSDMSIEAAGWLLRALAHDPASREAVSALRDRVVGGLGETSATAQVRNEDEGRLLLSPQRTMAVVLGALLEIAPEASNDNLNAKLVRGLLDSRRSTCWTTNIDAYALLALQQYAQRYEQSVPAMRSKAWLGSTLVLSSRLDGRAARDEVRVPFGDGDRKDVVLQRQGTGRLYYRVGLRAVDRDAAAPPIAHGFEVRRVLLTEGGEAVPRDADGAWRVKAGTRVVIQTTVKCRDMRCQVALESPLAAGFEASNGALAGSGREVENPWWTHRELHDERVDAFAWSLPVGAHAFQQAVQATTVGNYFLPAAHVEEMYHPETFGRSSSDRVSVY